MLTHMIVVLKHLNVFYSESFYLCVVFFSVIGNLNKVKICLNLAKNFCADTSKLIAIEAQIHEIDANAAIVTMQGMFFSFFQV